MQDLLIEYIDQFTKTIKIEYRLPPPIAATSTNNKLWNKLISIHPWLTHPLNILPSAKSVVVFAIPLSYDAIKSNVSGGEPSKQWLLEYIYTNKLIEEVGNYIAKELKSRGYKTISLKPTHDFDPKSLRSKWSHKHAGYIAGLGTFGINNLLITEKGCAVRLGTIITEAIIEETPKPSTEYCLVKRGYKCHKCVERCPIGALRNWDKGKHLCYSRLTKIALRFREELKARASACGKCAVGIPCAIKIP